MSDNQLLMGISKLMDVKMVPVYERFDRLDVKIDLLEERLNERIDQLEARIGQLDVKIGQLEERISQLEAKIGQLEERISQLEVRVVQLEERISQLEVRVGQIETRMDKVEGGLKGEIHNLWLVLEGEVRTDIKRLVENFPDVKKMRDTTDFIEQIRSDIEIHDVVISEHSERILALEKIS